MSDEELDVLVDLDEKKIIMRTNQVEIVLSPETARELAFGLTTASYQITEG